MRIKLGEYYCFIQNPWPKGTRFFLRDKSLSVTVPYKFMNMKTYTLNSITTCDSDSIESSEEELFRRYNVIRNCKHENLEYDHKSKPSLCHKKCKSCHFLSMYHSMPLIVLEAFQLNKLLNISDGFKNIQIYDYLFSLSDDNNLLSAALLMNIDPKETIRFPNAQVQEIILGLSDPENATLVETKLLKLAEAIFTLKNVGINMHQYSDDEVVRIIKINEKLMKSLPKSIGNSCGKNVVKTVVKELAYVLDSVNIIHNKRIKIKA